MELAVLPILIPLAYAAGCVPTAELVGRRLGFDPRADGSGNPGATNALRLGGSAAGVLVLLGDALKGAAPTLLGVHLGGPGVGAVVGAAAVLGHLAPMTRGGRGGKGVATTAGVAAALSPRCCCPSQRAASASPRSWCWCWACLPCSSWRAIVATWRASETPPSPGSAHPPVPRSPHAA